MYPLEYKAHEEIVLVLTHSVEKINELCEKINELEKQVEELKHERDNRSNGFKSNLEIDPYKFSL